MKYIIIVVTAATLGVGAHTAHAGWLDNGEKERRIEIQTQLTQQKHETSQWQGTAFALGIGCVLTLITGTIIGSRARNHANRTTS